MGLVFLAEDTELGRAVALKVIRPESAGRPGVAERFTREARATAAIKHDHIVTIYHVGRERDVSYLAMEYLQGMSLARWLERGRKPSIDLVLRLGREIAEGLAAAHRHGLIHRDIKPGNIWLEAPSGRIKILDFGQVHSEREDVQITQAGAILGTPAYMAPEQARGEPVGFQSDLFSLGCVLYRLCTGRLPFEGPTIMAILTALAAEDPAPPGELDSGLPAALDELVMRLLAKDAANRPASAQAVVETIKGIERDLTSERQRAEVIETGAWSAGMDGARAIPERLDAVPALRRDGTKQRPGRRGWWIAAATAVGAMVTATALLLAPGPSRGQRPVGPRTESLVVVAETDEGEVQETRAVGAIEIASTDKATEPEKVPGADATTVASRPVERLAETGSAPVAEAGVKTPVARAVWGDPIDPEGDCKLSWDETSGRIAINVPATAHILSAELGRMNAPRVLLAVEGDFECRVRVARLSRPGGRTTQREYAPYQGAGILLWQDDDNYLRLEIAADVHEGKVRPYANFELRSHGTLTYSRGQKITDGSNVVRLERRADELHAAFGTGGEQWTAFPPLTAKLADRLLIGVTAINTASKPLNAELDWFEIEDGHGSVKTRTMAQPGPGVQGPLSESTE
jgi:hypothetical protein